MSTCVVCQVDDESTVDADFEKFGLTSDEIEWLRSGVFVNKPYVQMKTRKRRPIH